MNTSRLAQARAALSCCAACSAFLRDLVALKERPSVGNVVPAHWTNHQVQHQVRLFIDQKAKSSVLLRR
jgi:hypothetical protein